MKRKPTSKEDIRLPVKLKPKTPRDRRNAALRGDHPDTFTGHLTEFRSRLLIVIITVCITTIIPFAFFGDKVLSFITRPYAAAVSGADLYLFDITEPFTTQLKASLTAGIFASVPVIIMQLWLFIKPAIDTGKRSFIRNTIAAAVILFYGGAVLAFQILLPFVIKTLQSFVIPGMKVMQGAGSYMSFIFLFCAVMGLVFELPLAVMILTKLGIVSSRFLAAKRTWAVIGIWIAAAIVTPTTDILTQAIIAIPLMALYEISIVLALIIERRDRKKQ